MVGAGFVLTSGCAPRRIPGTDLDDTPDNRAIIDVMGKYKKAFEARDVDGRLARAGRRVTALATRATRRAGTRCRGGRTGAGGGAGAGLTGVRPVLVHGAHASIRVLARDERWVRIT